MMLLSASLCGICALHFGTIARIDFCDITTPWPSARIRLLLVREAGQETKFWALGFDTQTRAWYDVRPGKHVEMFPTGVGGELLLDGQTTGTTSLDSAALGIVRFVFPQLYLSHACATGAIVDQHINSDGNTIVRDRAPRGNAFLSQQSGDAIQTETWETMISVSGRVLATRPANGSEANWMPIPDLSPDSLTQIGCVSPQWTLVDIQIDEGGQTFSRWEILQLRDDVARLQSEARYAAADLTPEQRDPAAAIPARIAGLAGPAPKESQRPFSWLFSGLGMACVIAGTVLWWRRRNA
jgi:hypothetical protein